MTATGAVLCRVQHSMALLVARLVANSNDHLDTGTMTNEFSSTVYERN
jgi:hypothetical protein